MGLATNLCRPSAWWCCPVGWEHNMQNLPFTSHTFRREIYWSVWAVLCCYKEEVQAQATVVDPRECSAPLCCSKYTEVRHRAGRPSPFVPGRGPIANMAGIWSLPALQILLSSRWAWLSKADENPRWVHKSEWTLPYLFTSQTNKQNLFCWF